MLNQKYIPHIYIQKYNGNIININDQIYVKIDDDYKTIHESDHINNIIYYKDDDYI